MNRITVLALRVLVIATGLKKTEDEILKGIVFNNDGRERIIEDKILKAQKEDGWQDKCHALSQDMGDCFKCAYRSPRRGDIGYWSWSYQPFKHLDNKRLILSHKAHGTIEVHRNDHGRGNKFHSISGEWKTLPQWKLEVLAMSLMSKFVLKVNKSMGI